MKKWYKKILITMLCTLALLFCFERKYYSAGESFETTILFTNDTHSHIVPATDLDGTSYGGYTRLYTLLKNYREAYGSRGPVLTLDAGDFSMGTLFQTLYTTEASELRLLGKMGFDATTFGNHEYDYRDEGLAAMLNAAIDSGDSLPQIVIANYYPPKEGEENYTEGSKAVWEAFEKYAVKEYTMIERDGIRYAVFGVFGENADEYSPMSGMVWENYIDAAERVVSEIKANEDYDYIICLSHSGTSDNESKSEDHKLAKAVDGIDVIISAHTHATLDEPVIVGDTIIVSSGCYTKNLGVLRIAKDAEGKTKVLDYMLVPVSGKVEENEEILNEANRYKDIISDTYLSGYGMEYDEVLAYSDFDFEGISNEQKELPLGNLIADSYVYAVKRAEGENYVNIDMAVTANGVIRDTFSKGNITVADAFNVSSLGVGADGTPGYPLVAVYVKGSEIKDIFEVDASVAPIMEVAQIYASGACWSYNTRRIIFNKVTDCCLVAEDGTRQEIEDDKLYRVVTGLYCGQMLGAVNSKSFGILSITPRDVNGNPVENLEDFIVCDARGNEVKEWYALASYLDSFEEKDGVPVIPDRYGRTEGRKNVYASFNPVELLKAPNWITITILAVLLVLICVVVFLAVYGKRRRRSKRTGKNRKF